MDASKIVVVFRLWTLVNLCLKIKKLKLISVNQIYLFMNILQIVIQHCVEKNRTFILPSDIALLCLAYPNLGKWLRNNKIINVRISRAFLNEKCKKNVQWKWI